MEPSRNDVEALVREKYAGDQDAEGVTADIARLSEGEPLAYVIGHQPFLGLSIGLGSHPLIPRPETEWWVEALCERIGDAPLRVLDLCAGSGAIGLALLKHCPNAHVSFAELVADHGALIQENIARNDLDASRATIRTGDLFAPFIGEQFDIIATNPPYIPEGRTLDASVTTYERREALYGGSDGLSVIRRIIEEAPRHTKELWMECDVDNVHEAARLMIQGKAHTTDVRTDQYGRPRLVVAYY